MSTKLKVDWPSLWAREPGLKPDKVCADTDGRLGLRLSGVQHYWDEPDNPATAIQRDTAVRWLRSLGHQTVVIDCVGDNEWYISVGAESICAQCVGFDNALFEVCERAIDSFIPHTPTPAAS